MGGITRRRLMGASISSAGIATAGRAASTPSAPQRDPLVLDDQSGLNATRTALNEVVAADADVAIERRVRDLLGAARRSGRPFCIGGARHSMGGQSLPPAGGFAVETSDTACSISASSRSYRVEAGARWREVIAALDPHGLSPAVMQSNNDFSVGGALSVNAHGWAVPCGPAASTVRSFRLMLSDGEVVSCSPDQNAELFHHALGGYGLFGVLLDVELAWVENSMLEPSRVRLRSSEFAAEFVRNVYDPRARLAYGRLSLMRDRFLEDTVLTAYHPAGRQPRPIPRAQGAKLSDALTQAIFRGQTGSDAGKRLRWWAETELMPAFAGAATRNSLLNVSVKSYAGADIGRTDILHEYFVPPAALEAFLKECRRLIPVSRQDLLNVTLRWVEADRVSVLTFAPEPRIALVMLFSQARGAAAEADMCKLTRGLIDAALDAGGGFYLPYRLHARPDQLRRGYPRLSDFIAAKRRWDPELRFRNQMWERYMAPLG